MIDKFSIWSDVMCDNVTLHRINDDSVHTLIHTRFRAHGRSLLLCILPSLHLFWSAAIPAFGSGASEEVPFIQKRGAIPIFDEFI